jgi:hypothetical protein
VRHKPQKNVQILASSGLMLGMESDGSRHAELESALATATTEQEISKVLKRHPLLISQVVGGFAYPNKVVAEFCFGSEYRADFVALGPYSGGWCIHFIELEPPTAPLFTKSGRPAERLNQAVSQVDSWRRFIATSKDTVLRELSKHVQKNELVLGERDYEPMDNGGWSLYDPRSWMNWHYHIVIGRRSALTLDQGGKKAAYQDMHGINVMTYDRLLDAAR